MGDLRRVRASPHPAGTVRVALTDRALAERLLPSDLASVPATGSASPRTPRRGSWSVPERRPRGRLPDAVGDLEAARARPWWRTGRRIGSLARAAAFVEDVGFALLFPEAGVELPSLWDAASDRPIRSLGEEWGPDAERVWGWKDELPRRGLAWYGWFLRGRPSFLSPALLADLYPRSGGRPGSRLRVDDARRQVGLGGARPPG